MSGSGRSKGQFKADFVSRDLTDEAVSVCGLRKVKHGEFAMASGEMSVSEFTEFLKRIFGVLVAYSVDGSIHFICMDCDLAPGVQSSLKFVLAQLEDQNMKRSRFSEEQIIAILKEHEAGLPVADLCRKHGVSDASIYKWKARYGGMDVSEARRLKTLEEENARLKRLLADAMLDNVALKDLLGKKW